MLKSERPWFRAYWSLSVAPGKSHGCCAALGRGGVRVKRRLLGVSARLESGLRSQDGVRAPQLQRAPPARIWGPVVLLPRGWGLMARGGRPALAGRH